MAAFFRFEAAQVNAAFNGVAMVFDLEGFTNFCKEQGTTHQFSQVLNDCFVHLAERFGHADEVSDPLTPLEIRGVSPVHCKFLGDGALVIWKLPLAAHEREAFLHALVHSVLLSYQEFEDTRANLVSIVGHDKVPHRLRFGIAAGQIQPLKPVGAGQVEYVGYPINLASRLQSYYRPLGFIFSARDFISDDLLEMHGFLKVKATQLKGFNDEIVVVDELTYRQLRSEKDGQNEQLLDWFSDSI